MDKEKKVYVLFVCIYVYMVMRLERGKGGYTDRRVNGRLLLFFLLTLSFLCLFPLARNTKTLDLVFEGLQY